LGPSSSEVKIEEITATELKRQIDLGKNIQIIDVRDSNEYAIARIPNSKLIPLSQIVERSKEIDPNLTAVLHCKGGIRSAKAINALKESGFAGTLVNLKGGILAWSNEVDPSVPKY
jgi:adenylyltransferase/sulfurtransferase